MGRFKFAGASLNCDGWRGATLLGLCGLLLIIAAAGHTAVIVLRYERAPIAAGEGWRLLTAHVVHLGFGHALMNAAGLALMWALFAREYAPRRWLWIVLTAIATVDAGLWLFDPRIEWYVGLSGVLHGVMAAGTLGRLRTGAPDGWLLAAFLVGKLVYEQLAGGMPFSSGIGPVIVNAHLYGAVGGGAAAMLQRRRASL